MATATIETWFEQDIKEAVKVKYLNGNVFSQDSKANVIGVKLYSNGQQASIEGDVSANIIRPDGATVAVVGEILDGYRAYILMPAAAYVVPGVISIIIKISTSNKVTTVCAVVANVYQSSTDVAVDPGSIMPSIQNLITTIEDAIASIPPDYSSLSAMVSRTFCGSYSDATTITTGQDFNSFLTPGNYVGTSSTVVASCSNAPVGAAGRLYVFSSIGTTAFIQIYITASSSDVYIRRASTSSGSNTAWNKMPKGTDVDNSIKSQGLVSTGDVDNFPNGSVIGVATTDINTVSHFPSDYQSGGSVITTGYRTDGSTIGLLQVCYFFDNNYFAWRRKTSTGFTAWNYEGIVTLVRTVGETGRNFTDPAYALKYYTDKEYMGLWNEHYRLEIVIDPGTYNITQRMEQFYSGDSTRFQYGLYIPPYCTIRGSGKKNTIITFAPTYSNPSDDRISAMSPLNMPYESTLQDLSIIAQNCRYCVHSETGFPGYSDASNPISPTWVNNNNITVKNVYFEHQGINSSYTPSYSSPACWGNGSYNNTNETFIDCEFVAAQYPAWLTHNRTGLTDKSTFVFENCRFINKLETTYSIGSPYTSIMLISWADDDIKIPVYFKNCYVNRMASIRVRTTDPASANAICNYYVTSDNGMMITEQNENNSIDSDNYISGNCSVCYADGAVTAYTPVSFNDYGGAHAYSSNDPYHGIALHNAASGGEIVVQTSGKIDLASCGITGFSAGSLIGYSNGWVVDNVNPIIKCATANVGVIV